MTGERGPAMVRGSLWGSTTGRGVRDDGREGSAMVRRVRRWRERFEIVGRDVGIQAEPWGSAFLFYSTRT